MKFDFNSFISTAFNRRKIKTILYTIQDLFKNKILYFKKTILGIFSFIVFLFFAYWGFYTWLEIPSGQGEHSFNFLLKAGTGSNQIANLLEENKIINSELKFKIVLRLEKKARKIKSGFYSLDDSMSVSEIIAVITSGRSKEIHITIPEGFNNRQIADLLIQKKISNSREEFLKATSDKEILKKYNIPATTVEGYLFPDTYFIPTYFKSKDVIKMMLDKFVKVTRELDGFPSEPKKIHNLVILASIVEREAQRKEERALIAGVFTNRLEKNIPLESCATVQYLFEKPKERLYYSDLEIKSPYNTYKNNGLPPTPIASPGKAALESALHPKKTDYLFFVVKGNGYHQFSTNFKDHNKAKENYILKD